MGGPLNLYIILGVAVSQILRNPDTGHFRSALSAILNNASFVVMIMLHIQITVAKHEAYLKNI
jgi:hypothetical protein